MTSHSMHTFQKPDTHGAYLPTEQQIAAKAAKIKKRNLKAMRDRVAGEKVVQPTRRLKKGRRHLRG